MIKNTIKIKYDIDGRNMESSETNETKTMADYLPSIPNQKDRDEAVTREQDGKVSFDDFVNKLGKLVHSDEMKELEKLISTLTKQEMKDLLDFVNNNIKPEIDNFKNSLKEKGLLDTIEAFKKEARQIIQELNQKIKEIKEKGGSKSDLIKAETQNALLSQAMGISSNKEKDVLARNRELTKNSEREILYKAVTDLMDPFEGMSYYSINDWVTDVVNNEEYRNIKDTGFINYDVLSKDIPQKIVTLLHKKGGFTQGFKQEFRKYIKEVISNPDNMQMADR